MMRLRPLAIAFCPGLFLNSDANGNDDFDASCLIACRRRRSIACICMLQRKFETRCAE